MGRPGWTVGLLASMLLGISASAARAATITVTTTADEVAADGHCSLREAVIAANTDTSGPGDDCISGSGGDAIALAGGTPYKLTIAPAGTDDATSGDLNLTQPVTIAGAGAASTTIDAGGIDRVFEVASSGVQIAGVTVTGGNPGIGERGGGIMVFSTGASLALTNSIVTGNQAYEGGGLAAGGASITISDSTIDHNHGGAGGGGILNNAASMTITRTRISNNTAARAAGVFENGGKLTISNSSVSDNGEAATTMQAGGLEIDGGPTTLTDVQVTGNVANNVGGGIFSDVRPAQATTLTRTVVSGNSLMPRVSGQAVDGGGIYVQGALNLVDSWVHDNSALGGAGSAGGGILFSPRNSNEQLQIQGSTVGPGNRADSGDGVDLANEPSDGPVSATLVRSTVAGNGDDLAFGEGGGIYVGSYVTANLRDDTLAENKASNTTGGGNLYAQANSTVEWQNTLVARAFGGGNCDHGTPASLITNGGNQEYGDPDAKCGFQTQAGDRGSPTDLDTNQLGELQNNGGPTETMALLPGAPPADTGLGCEPTDQRGVPRPQGSACDSGAYELDTTAPSTMITSGPTGTTSGNVVSFTFTADEPASFGCELDGAGFLPCSSPFTSGPLAAGPHTFSVRATDIAGNAGPAASRAFSVVAGGNGSTGGRPGGNNATGGGPGGSSPPTITAVSESARAWREGNALPKMSRVRAPVGTTFSFTLNEPAIALFTFKRAVYGRRINGRCVPPTHANRLRHRCRYLATAATLHVQVHTGLNHLRFAGRLSRRRRLPPGSYTLIITAVVGRSTSPPAVLRFTILRR